MNDGNYIENIKISVIGERNVKSNQATNKIYTLEEAVHEAKNGKCQVILIFLTGLAVMGSILENVNFSYVLPFARCDLNLTSFEQGFLTSISFLGIVSTSHFWGFLADTIGRQKVIKIAAFGGYIFSSVSAFATHTAALIILRFFAGAFLAGAQAGTLSYISEFHTVAKAGRAAATISVFISGVFIYMSSIAFVIFVNEWTISIASFELTPWRLFLLCTSTLNLFNGIVFSLLPETPKFLLALNRKEEALCVLSRVYAINTGKPRETYPVKDIVQQPLNPNSNVRKGCFDVVLLLWNQTKPIFTRPLLSSTWKLSFTIFANFAIAHGTIMWFPYFVHQLKNHSGSPGTLCSVINNNGESKCGDYKDMTLIQLMFGIGVLFVIISALASFAMKIIKPKLIIYAWLIFSTISCFLLNFMTGFHWIVTSYIAFVSCVVCSNILLAIAVNLYPTSYRAMATSFILMCGRIGGFVGSNIVGILLEDYCPYIFYIFCGVLIVFFIVVVMLRTHPKDGGSTDSHSDP